MPTTYDDGLPHTVSGASDEVLVTSPDPMDLTSVTFDTGAAVAGTDAADPTDPTDCGVYAVFSQGSVLQFNDGTFAGGAGEPSPWTNGATVLSYQDQTAAFAGGTFTGATSAAVCGGPAVILDSPVSGSVSGGTYTGGDSADGYGAPAVILRLPTSLSLTVSGGTFAGGSGPAGGGFALSASVSGLLTVSGGTYTGSLAFSLYDGGPGLGTVTFNGSGLSYSGDGTGGTLTGTLGGSSVTLDLVNLAAADWVVSGSGSSVTLSPS